MRTGLLLLSLLLSASACEFSQDEFDDLETEEVAAGVPFLACGCRVAAQAVTTPTCKIRQAVGYGDAVQRCNRTCTRAAATGAILQPTPAAAILAALPRC